MKKFKFLILGFLLSLIALNPTSNKTSNTFSLNDDDLAINYQDFNKKTKIDNSIVSQEWNSRIFGRYQNSKKPKFETSFSDEKVTLDVDTLDSNYSNAFPKMTSKATAAGDSLGYYYKEIYNTDISFSFSAVMDIEDIHPVSSTSVNYGNYGLGIMVRDDIGLDGNENNYFETYKKPFVAVGNYGLPAGTKTNNIFCRKDDENKTFANLKSQYQILPSTDNLIKKAKLLIEKNDDKFYLKYELEGLNSLIDYTYSDAIFNQAKKLYVGLFVAGPLKVSFSNIQFEIKNDNNETWKSAVFGHLNQNNIGTLNYNVDSSLDHIVMEDGINNAANFTKTVSKYYSFVFAYKEIDANKDFTLKAKMKIEDIKNSTDTSVMSCGLQVRDHVRTKEFIENYNKDFVAVGNFGLPFINTKDNTSYSYNFGHWPNSLGQNVNVIPRFDEENKKLVDCDIVDLTITKTGNKYTLKYSDIQQSIDKKFISSDDMALETNNKKLYVGVYISGPIKVSFSEVSLECIGANEFVGTQLTQDENSIRFVGKVYVGSEDLEKLSEKYKALKFKIYVQIDGAYKYAELETTGLMKSIQNGESPLDAEEGYYFFTVKIINIPEKVDFRFIKAETAILSNQ